MKAIIIWTIGVAVLVKLVGMVPEMVFGMVM
jgi:hypothetical protein